MDVLEKSIHVNTSGRNLFQLAQFHPKLLQSRLDAYKTELHTTFCEVLIQRLWSSCLWLIMIITSTREVSSSPLYPSVSFVSPAQPNCSTSFMVSTRLNSSPVKSLEWNLQFITGGKHWGNPRRAQCQYLICKTSQPLARTTLSCVKRHLQAPVTDQELSENMNACIFIKTLFHLGKQNG